MRSVEKTSYTWYNTAINLNFSNKKETAMVSFVIIEIFNVVQKFILSKGYFLLKITSFVRSKTGRAIARAFLAPSFNMS